MANHLFRNLKIFHFIYEGKEESEEPEEVNERQTIKCFKNCKSSETNIRSIS
jgi:hypothetical protein